MPPRRRVSSGPTAASNRAQATLSFHGKSNKVTKPSLTASNKTKKDPTVVEAITGTNLNASANSDLAAPTTAEVAIAEQAKQKPVKQEAPEKRTAEDEEALRVSDAQVAQYWRGKEKSRMAPRVHQEGLGLWEKVLREWDMSGQYGPCIGIARTKRWRRAHKLGLKPPIEVLAVLLRQQEEGNIKAQRAHVDELMSSRFIET
ncbi:DNA polymerase delta, subunit 4-domain-containing protein [Cryomyces antarcticus]